jgi:hypothetical protein
LIIGGGAIVTVDLVVVPPFLLVCGLYVHIYLVLKKEIIFFNLKEKKKIKCQYHVILQIIIKKTNIVILINKKRDRKRFII